MVAYHRCGVSVVSGDWGAAYVEIRGWDGWVFMERENFRWHDQHSDDMVPFVGK